MSFEPGIAKTTVNFGGNSVVYEEPIDQHKVGVPTKAGSGDSAENPAKGEPQMEKPSAVNPSTVRTPIVKTESRSTDSERTEDQIRERARPPAAPLNHLSEEFSLDDELRQFAKACGCDVDDELRVFWKYCESKKKHYSDFRSAFMGWLEKTARFGRAVHVPQGNEVSGERDWEAIARKHEPGEVRYDQKGRKYCPRFRWSCTPVPTISVTNHSAAADRN
jgi:hypothetical protein